ncbi:biotin-dependent carboxyltransferase family protein [Yoonia sp. SS1-5]|uniref:Biotin-dependent carboxyltransferase family protein n=1 Tax=Yoonia rhodophyticola TaxID=3137370 RepID=A0AAN0MDI5_9RHOB
MTALHVHKVGPGVTIQDLGRPGWTAQGLPCGGATDRHALIEAYALLNTGLGAAVLEMMGFGGTFSVTADTRITLTGARMQATIDDSPVPPNQTRLLRKGEMLTIGGALRGVYGYLAFAGGIDTPPALDSRATHLTAGIGRALVQGDVIPLGKDPAPLSGPHALEPGDRLGGGPIRIMPGPQTDDFAAAIRATFAETSFERSPRGNRQGVRLDHEGAGFAMAGALNIVSDLILPGDVQMTGDGVPYVLLAECQTIGGYPRIGTVIPADLPKVAQAAPGTQLTFTWLSMAEAEATYISDPQLYRQMSEACRPVHRDPHDIPDLLGYQLISGVTSGDDIERS